jgi:hypothetical protein
LGSFGWNIRTIMGPFRMADLGIWERDEIPPKRL